MNQNRRMTRILSALAICVGIQTSHAQAPGRVDMAVTFAAIDAAHAGGAGNFFLYGGAVEAHASLYRGLGIVASVTGVHRESDNAAIAPLDLVVTTFGPRYTWQPRMIGSRISLYGQGLIGEADGFHSVFATGSGPVNFVNGTTTSANSLAVETGGGLDIRISRRFAIRAIQAEYLRTQLPNGSDNTQNNLRLATGIVFRSTR